MGSQRLGQRLAAIDRDTVIALLAQRYNAAVVCGYAMRRGMRFMYEVGTTDVIYPEDWADQPDPLFYITARYRRAIERMVRSFPEQYLWMHRIWKSRPRHEVKNRPFPAALRDKLLALPWLSSEDVEQLIDRSNRDACWLNEHDTDRLP